jgi:xylose isomerase
MRSYLILKEKARQFNGDAEIQALLKEVQTGDEPGQLLGAYSAERADALKAHAFDRARLGNRALHYERIDQLLFDLLMGVR